MLVTIVAGARPNFMKIAPIIKAIDLAKSEGRDIEWRLIHTGQHYDKKMSEDFFEQLGIPDPDNNLGCGGGTQAEQTAAIMVKFEKELQEYRPDIVLVVERKSNPSMKWFNIHLREVINMDYFNIDGIKNFLLGIGEFKNWWELKN